MQNRILESKIGTNELHEIVTAMFGGAAFFATLAFIKTFSQKKLGFDLHVDTPCLSQNDTILLVFLGELNREYYELDSIACNRICLCAEDLLYIRTHPHSKSPSDLKEDAYIAYALYKENMKRILELKKDITKNMKNILKKINNQFQSHLEFIMASYSK